MVSLALCTILLLVAGTANAEEVSVCPAIRCTRQYMPVCGTNGVTYSNRCVMRSMNCGNDILAYTEACQPGAECEIDVLCAETASFVCGSNGVTYRNSCIMFQQNCNNVTKSADGECE